MCYLARLGGVGPYLLLPTLSRTHACTIGPSGKGNRIARLNIQKFPKHSLCKGTYRESDLGVTWDSVVQDKGTNGSIYTIAHFVQPVKSFSLFLSSDAPFMNPACLLLRYIITLDFGQTAIGRPQKDKGSERERCYILWLDFVKPQYIASSFSFSFPTSKLLGFVQSPVL